MTVFIDLIPVAVKERHYPLQPGQPCPFALAGCAQVTHAGVMHFKSHAAEGLQDLQV